jgi:phosphoesterase RecJ-like protein
MLNNIMTDAEQNLLSGRIQSANRIVICCHTSPDGDAIGSSLGLADYLRACGKTASIIIPNAYPDFLQWLPGTEAILRFDKYEIAKNVIADADLIFCLDFNELSRVDAMAEVLGNAKGDKIMIDHHLNPSFDCLLLVSHPEMSSTCEIVFRVIWQLGGYEKMNKKSATSIYCGMMTDTGGFIYNSNSGDVYFIISQLLNKGINKDKIYRKVYYNYSEYRLRLLGHIMLDKLVNVPEMHATFFTLTKGEMRRFHFIKGDAEGLVNMPLQIKGTKLSISLREDTEQENLIRVSLRSVDDFPCNQMSELFFNGGGHLNASGGELHCSMDEAINVVKQALVHFEQKLREKPVNIL